MIRDRDTLEALRTAIAEFVRDRLVPHETLVEHSDAVPEFLVDEMRSLGLFGLSIPEAYGGLDMTMEEEVLIAFELGKTSPAFRTTFATNNGIGSQGIVIDGTAEQKSRYLPRLASGASIASFALTEPGAGSDAASLSTTAVRHGDHYVLNGTKRFITNAPRADLFTVMARTDPADATARGISAFIVERGTPGLELGPIDRKMGQHGSPTCDVVFRDCEIPAANLIGGREGRGFKTAMKVLDKGRLHIAAVCVGAAERMLADALAYALERRQFGKPIAEFQLLQAMLADSRMEILAARALVLDAARTRDDGRDVVAEAACAKLFASEMCGRVADRALQIHGGAGYMTDYAIERFYRDVRLFRIFEGTSQILQLVIARELIRGAEA